MVAAGKAANEEAKQERQPHEKQGKKAKKRKTIDFSKYRHRHIAFHVAYDGKKFSGFAAQGDEAGASKFELMVNHSGQLLDRKEGRKEANELLRISFGVVVLVLQKILSRSTSFMHLRRHA